MDKNIIQKGIENIKNIKLSENEKKEMLINISVYIDRTLKNITIKPSPYFSIFSIFTQRHFTTTFAFLLVFGIIGGVTVFAAEKSLPGDFLYPIKVNVNEPAVGVTKVNNSLKVNWEAEKASRRLEEAEALTVQGRLDSESRKEIEIRFSENVEKFNEFAKQEDDKIKSQKQSSNIEIEKINNTRTNFENDISKHANNLDKMKEKLSDDKKIEVEFLKNVLLKRSQNKEENQNKSNNTEEIKKINNKKTEVENKVDLEKSGGNGEKNDNDS